jgi:hypothetical protein
MASLAFYAAPIGQETTIQEPIDNKRTSRNHNKTIKRYSDTSTNKVENMKKQLFQGMDSSESQLSDFNPPNMPQSAGVQRTQLQEEDTVVQPSPLQSQDTPVNVENFNTLPDTSSDDYYKQHIPYYDKPSNLGNNTELVNKLDYMIYLLEQQKEQKTDSATEEIILYSFLGIFIIFVLDSFARAGKYTR